MFSGKNNIVLDCNQMKFPQSGLYTYCYSLSEHIQNKLQNDPELNFSVYIEKKNKSDFPFPVKKYFRRHGFEKIITPQHISCRIWHLPFQGGKWAISRWAHPGLKRVLTIHDLNMLHEGPGTKAVQEKLNHIQKLIEDTDAIICISEFCKKDVTANCNTGNKPIHVIHNGVGVTNDGKLNTNSYKPARPFLFALGYVNAKKNFHVLLPLLENNELELIITGHQEEADYTDFIRKEAKRKGVEDRLTLTGAVSEDEKNWYLANCMAFLHSSLAEGFGLPVAEAMQYGKPLFLSGRTALPEIGGDAAFYFHDFSADHVRKVFEEGMKKYTANNMSEYIKQRATLFNWHQQAAKYIGVYKSLL